MDPQAKKKWGRAVGLALGVGLLAGMLTLSLVSSAGHADWARLTHAAWWQVALLLAGVTAQLVLSGLLFWVVTLSFDARPRVALGEMIAVITLSAAMNYLPMTGAVGRAAYMNLRHALPIRQSVLIQLIVIALSMIVSVVAVAIMTLGRDPRVVGVAAVVLFGVLAMAVSMVASWIFKRPIVGAWAWVLIRLGELLVSSVRLWAAFAIMGYDVSAAQVIACSAAGFFVSLTGLTPNGLGVREWAVAAVAHVMTPELGAAAAAAPLIDRAAEVVVFAIGGAISARWLGRKELRGVLKERAE